MKRRTFMKTTASASAALLVNKPGDTAFLSRRTSDRMLFPRPQNRAMCDISPPGLAWLPCPDAANYRVFIYDRGGRPVYEKKAGVDPVHVPDVVLPQGEYTWDVAALDTAGSDIARRGKLAFTINPGVPQLPWVPPAELLSRVPTEHPRILYRRQTLQEIRDTLATRRKKSWQACKEAADRALDKGLPAFPAYHKIDDPVVRRMEYQKYFGYFRGFVDGALMDLALGYLMTEKQEYAGAAKNILLHIAQWPVDDDHVSSVNAKWGDEVGLSFSKCAHVAYDWLYEALDESERAAVREMCRGRARQTLRRLKERKNYLTYPGESHDGRLIAYLSGMALAMAGETTGPETWLDYSLKALLTFYPHWAGSDGGWAEGTAYGLWYNTFYIPALQGLEQLCGYNLWQRPFFNNIRYFFFYCTANHGEIRPFGDSAERGGPGVNNGSGYDDLLAFHARRYEDPYIGWWVEQIPGYSGGRSGRMALLYPDNLPCKPPDGLPQSRVFESVGWAGLHSDLTRPERDTCMIFKSSPYGSVSHSHADQNAFAVMKGGTALAIPSGHYGPSYGKPHHAEWTRSTKANNCILVNGRGQTIRKAAASGRIVRFWDTKSCSYVSGDATAAYMGLLEKWYRHILFLRPGLFLLLDEISAPAPSVFQWMLHAFEKMQMENDRIVSRRKNAVLDIHLSCSQDLKLDQTDRFDTPFNHGIPEKYHRNMPLHRHVTAETVHKSTSVRIAALMGVYTTGEKFEQELLVTDGWFGTEVQCDDGTVKGWIRTGNVATGPEGFGRDVHKGKADICGVGIDGKVVVV